MQMRLGFWSAHEEVQARKVVVLWSRAKLEAAAKERKAQETATHVKKAEAGRPVALGVR